MRQDIWILRAPRLNANDEVLTLTRWLRPDRSNVVAGDPVAEIETEKATAEVAADASGILVHAVAAGDTAVIGAPLAYVGDAAAIDTARIEAPIPNAPPATGRHDVTPKARTLAAQRGVDLAEVRASGATIKERDVARYLAEHGEPTGIIAGDPRLVLVGDASSHHSRVARDLRAAARAGLFTTLAYRLDLRGPERVIAAELAQGRAVSLLAVLLHALGKTVSEFPALQSVVDRGKVYRYRDVDIAVAVRSPAGELFAPVVRGLDRLSLVGIAAECARLAKSAMRGKLAATDIGGACLAVSLIPTPNVESFAALPMPFQSAILAVGAARHEVALTAAGPVAQPVTTVTITYDHALCDGIMVAEFCATLDRALNPGQA